MALYPRHVAKRLTELLGSMPSVYITGARQCGKTTLALEVGDSLGFEYVSLDDETYRRAAIEDPSGFVRDLPRRVILDEVQRAPELYTSIKHEIDRDRTNGRFLLTGSASNEATDHLKYLLTGRMGLIRLHPLSRSEVTDKPSSLLDILFTDAQEVGRHPRLGDELYRIVATGGYPPVFASNSAVVRQEWFDAYIDSQVRRTIREISRAAMLDDLPTILRAISGQTAHMLNLEQLAGRLRHSRTTMTRYMSTLRDVFLVDSLPPWESNRLKRLIRNSKLHMADTGLACAVLRVDAPTLASDRALWGQLFETFVVNEVRKETTWSEMSGIDLYHFRDREGGEVDIVVDAGHRGIAGIEVKAAATVGDGDFKGLRKLQRVTGDRFAKGIVLYDGEVCAPFGDGLWAVPAGMVWG